MSSPVVDVHSFNTMHRKVLGYIFVDIQDMQSIPENISKLLIHSDKELVCGNLTICDEIDLYQYENGKMKPFNIFTEISTYKDNVRPIYKKVTRLLGNKDPEFIPFLNPLVLTHISEHSRLTRTAKTTIVKLFAAIVNKKIKSHSDSVRISSNLTTEPIPEIIDCFSKTSLEQYMEDNKIPLDENKEIIEEYLLNDISQGCDHLLRSIDHWIESIDDYQWHFYWIKLDLPKGFILHRGIDYRIYDWTAMKVGADGCEPIDL